MEPNATHRQDIDGLRAIAVLLVVFYHYGISPFSGGYVGVDVFFVISGYVITAKVCRELAAGTFTLRGFYAGRVRRILPALVLMIGASMVAGWFLLMPSDFHSLGKQAAFAAVGLSNFYFLENSGYFARASDLLPLLHTWSLGIEEQFYILWPWLLLAIVHLDLTKKQTICVLTGLIVISVALSTVIVAGDQPTAFYMLHTRAWELALGGLLTFLPPLKRSLFANLVGLSLIGLSAVFLAPQSTFPGPLAIPVCLGTALLIWPKRSHDIIERNLGAWPLAVLGKLSYSLYLWHWPLLVFYRHFNFEQDPALEWKIVLIAASTIMAAVSWYVVEQPIRTSNILRKISVPLPAAASVIVACFGIGVVVNSGFPHRIPAAALAVAEGALDRSEHRTRCHRPGALARSSIGDSCVLGAEGVEPTAVIWGDSPAVELGDALSQPIARSGGSLLSITYSSCPPAIGFEREIEPRCDEHNAAVLDYLSASPTIERVFLVGTYEGVLRENAAKFTEALRSTVETLTATGKEVILFAPVPRQNASIPLVASRMMMHDENNVLTISYEKYRETNRAVLELFDEFDPMDGVTVIQVAPILCDDTNCRTVASGHSLYSDGHHPSTFGAKWIIDRIWDQVPLQPLRAASPLATTP